MRVKGIVDTHRLMEGEERRMKECLGVDLSAFSVTLTRTRPEGANPPSEEIDVDGAIPCSSSSSVEGVLDAFPPPRYTSGLSDSLSVPME